MESMTRFEGNIRLLHPFPDLVLRAVEDRISTFEVLGFDLRDEQASLRLGHFMEQFRNCGLSLEDSSFGVDSPLVRGVSGFF